MKSSREMDVKKMKEVIGQTILEILVEDPETIYPVSYTHLTDDSRPGNCKYGCSKRYGDIRSGCTGDPV